MGRYFFLEHTGDIRMKVEADSLDELFRVALAGMNHVIAGDHQPGGQEARSLALDIESLDETALLVDFLSEVLAETHTEYAVYGELTILSLGEGRLRAHLNGQTVGGFEEDIKAVTYHEAQVIKDKEGCYHCVIVFDI